MVGLRALEALRIASRSPVPPSCHYVRQRRTTARSADRARHRERRRSDALSIRAGAARSAVTVRRLVQSLSERGGIPVLLQRSVAEATFGIPRSNVNSCGRPRPHLILAPLHRRDRYAI